MTHYVSVHEAKTHLSRLIKKIGEGEDIVITSYGKPVATLAPAVMPQKRRLAPTKYIAWGKKHPLPVDFDEPMPDAWFETDEFPQASRKKRKLKS